MPLSHFFCAQGTKPTRLLYSFCYVPHPNDIMKSARLDEMVMKKTDKKQHRTIQGPGQELRQWETLKIYSPVSNIQFLEELSHT